jgi:uncharacterized sporulation protein YeaH/YhbH (DUF444 family)
MGLRDDLDRYRKVGEENRQDLEDFIKHADLSQGQGDIRVPIKIISLPEFKYSKLDEGGIGSGEGDEEVGDPVEEDGDGEGDEAGDGSEEHDYYEMDPEEFAQELDDQLGLDLEPKGKKVKEETEGDLTEMAQTGPDSTLVVEELFKKGIKRKVATYFDEEYLKEVLKVSGYGPEKTFNWARKKSMPVSKSWIKNESDEIPLEQKTKYESIDDIDKTLKTTPPREAFNSVPLRSEDKRHRYPEIKEKKEKNAVIVNIRDVSGSMGKDKRELVERTFTPMDWYLQGKYDNAEFIYIVHDTEAWEVEHENFFGIKSGGGTLISSAYELTQQIFEEKYPWDEWNRFVFAAGDGENTSKDTEQNVIPLLEEIKANRHGYIEVSASRRRQKTHGEELVKHFSGNTGEVRVAEVTNKNEVIEAIATVLSKPGDSNEE